MTVEAISSVTDLSIGAAELTTGCRSHHSTPGVACVNCSFTRRGIDGDAAEESHIGSRDRRLCSAEGVARLHANAPGQRQRCGVPHRQVQALRRGEALAAALVAYAGCQELSPASIEVLPFLSSFANLLWHTLDRRIVVTVDVERDCPALFVDAPALEEALTQIVRNAQSAMPHGGRLVLRGALDRRDSRLLNLDVIDKGTGMSPDVVERAASPFFTTKEGSPFPAWAFRPLPASRPSRAAGCPFPAPLDGGQPFACPCRQPRTLAADREERSHQSHTPGESHRGFWKPGRTVHSCDLGESFFRDARHGRHRRLEIGPSRRKGRDPGLDQTCGNEYRHMPDFLCLDHLHR